MTSITHERPQAQEIIDLDILHDDLAFVLHEARALAADERTCLERKTNAALLYIARIALDQQQIIRTLSARIAALEAYETVAQAEDLAYGLHEEFTFDEEAL